MMVWKSVVSMAPWMLIEYQSADSVRPGTKLGVSTTPPETVTAFSGCRPLLPPILAKHGYCGELDG